jgi:hypothetical protein
MEADTMRNHNDSTPKRACGICRKLFTIENLTIDYIDDLAWCDDCARPKTIEAQIASHRREVERLTAPVLS